MENFTNINGVGFLITDLFDNKVDYFKEFHAWHNPQDLTDSNKDSFAYRKGVYLSEVKEEKNALIFNLLRCSSNLNGPTENFSEHDRIIINKVNEAAKKLYPNSAILNHVLAQVYHNKKINGRDRNAKIAKHSDKTKDMPENGLMAFCSFYNIQPNKYHKDPNDPHNILYKKTSALTTLRFALKENVKEQCLSKKFDVLLYPNSVFIMDLKSNALYTHEIVPPLLSSDDIPTRLGYVIRCSNQLAMHDGDKAYIFDSIDGWTPLENPTLEGATKLKKIYLDENQSSVRPYYDICNFSFNSGDYMSPILDLKKIQQC